MSKIVFFADATADIPVEFLRAHPNVQVLGIFYSIGETAGIYTVAETPQMLDNFYKQMRNGDRVSTSMILYNHAYKSFEPFFAKGWDIIFLGLSPVLSTKMRENIITAGEDLAKKYKRKFSAPDTKSVTIKNYVLIRHALEIEKENSFEQIVERLVQVSDSIEIYFTVEDLKYLYRGGRLSAAAKLFGGILNIKPIISIDKNGALAPLAKKIGRNQSLQYLASRTTRLTQNDEVWILHADCPADAEVLRQKVLGINPNFKINILQIGVIIGSHGGPGIIGLGFVKNYC